MKEEDKENICTLEEAFGEEATKLICISNWIAAEGAKRFSTSDLVIGANLFIALTNIQNNMDLSVSLKSCELSFKMAQKILKDIPESGKTLVHS